MQTINATEHDATMLISSTIPVTFTKTRQEAASASQGPAFF